MIRSPSGSTRPRSIPSRGAAPVGVLPDLPPVERIAVLLLRAWCEGGEQRAAIRADLARVLGRDAANAACEDIASLIDLAVSCARRPLMRHGLACACFGGDECAFANMLAAGAVRDREDSLLFACALMNGPAAFEAVRLCEALGEGVLGLARHSNRMASHRGHTKH